MPTQPKDFTIIDLSGGYNDSIPPTSIAPNQCVTAENIDFFRAPVGARRKGCTAITLPSSLSSKAQITFLHRNVHTVDESGAELWAFATTVGVSSQISYKDTAWHDVSFVDPPTNTGVYPYQFVAQSLHGKMFLAYKSEVDILHVWDGTNLRRVGLQEPDFPIGANQGSGSFTTVRYYRIRETVQINTVTVLRSEPSTEVQFTPSGTGAGVTVTKGATENSNATHWELEASLNGFDFYVIDTVVIGTTSTIDTTSAAAGYAASFELSEDIGDYTPIPSGRFLLADQDRLLIGGSFDDDAAASIIRWTPVTNDPGVGNDERIPIDTDNLLNLDGLEGGGLTGLAGPISGSAFAFKTSHIYRLLRTGERINAYEAVVLSKTRGALPGSIVEAVDESGRPALYFLDPKVGPVRLGDSGLLVAGSDIINTWESVNVDATLVVSRVIFYPNKNQISWWVATGSANTPDLRINLQIDSSRVVEDGLRLGWTKHTGSSSEALATTMFSTNIESNTTRSQKLKPFIGVDNTILMMDDGNTDNGDAYTADLISRPYLVSGSITNKFGIRAASLIADANASAVVQLSLIRDFGRETCTPVNLSLAPVASEDPTISVVDNIKLSESKVVQVRLTDGTANASQWAIQRIDLVTRAEETS